MISRLRVLALLLLPSAATAVAAGSGACSSSASVEPPRHTITVGLSVSLSGGNRGVGAALRDGTVTAINVINARGGVLGKSLQLDVKDDATDNSRQAGGGGILRGVVNGFLERKVAAILGPGSSVQLNEAQKVTVPRDDAGALLPGAQPMLMISAWATSPTITTAQPPWPDRYLYRTAPSDAYASRAMFKLMTTDALAVGDAGVAVDAGVLVRSHKCRVPFLIYSRDEVGEGYLAYLPGAFREIGVTLGTVGVDTGEQQDYSKEIDAIKASRADCIAFAAYLEAGVSMIPKLMAAIAATPDYPKDVVVIGNDALYDQKLIDEVTKTDPSALEGIIGVVPEPAPQTPQYVDFRRIYQAHSGTSDNPPPYSAHAFDAAVLLALAIQKAGTDTDVRRVRDALVEVSRGYPGGVAVPSTGATMVGPGELDRAFSAIAAGTPIDYYGASGPVNFDDAGDVAGSYNAWTISGGQFHTGQQYKGSDL